jgi:hypothetical protein
MELEARTIELYTVYTRTTVILHTFLMQAHTVRPRRLGRILPNIYLCPLLQLGNRKIEFRTIWKFGQMAIIGVFRVFRGANCILKFYY